MLIMTSRIGRSIAVGALCLGVSFAVPPAVAAPEATLPPIASTGGGPIIGISDQAAEIRMSGQLSTLGSPDVQEGNGADAASFIMDAAGVANNRLAAAFVPLQRALGCQKDNTSYGARAYRRADGQWGGAVLVIEQSSTSNLDALTKCIKSVWPVATPGGPASMCAGGWTYPSSGLDHRPDRYYILIAGTAGDFCSSLNERYANFATKWP